MIKYRYNLDRNNQTKKVDCPYCGAKKRFTRYIDCHTKEPLHNLVGICDRINSCGAHYTPKQYFEERGVTVRHTDYKVNIPKVVKPERSYLEPRLINSQYEHTTFYKSLVKVYGVSECEVKKALRRYMVGGGRFGKVVFYYIDKFGNYRTGKIMAYNDQCRRIGSPKWAHKYDSKGDMYILETCLFGEHLYFDDMEKPIGIVESEKTAVIASIFHPQYVWMASGGATLLNADKIKNLGGRTIHLFPDSDQWDSWNEKFKSMAWINELTHVKESGKDLADMFLSNNKQTLEDISRELRA